MPSTIGSTYRRSGGLALPYASPLVVRATRSSVVMSVLPSWQLALGRIFHALAPFFISLRSDDRPPTDLYGRGHFTLAAPVIESCGANPSVSAPFRNRKGCSLFTFDWKISSGSDHRPWPSAER